MAAVRKNVHDRSRAVLTFLRRSIHIPASHIPAPNPNTRRGRQEYGWQEYGGRGKAPITTKVQVRALSEEGFQRDTVEDHLRRFLERAPLQAIPRANVFKHDVAFTTLKK
jgi:hypothetical protein